MDQRVLQIVAEALERPGPEREPFVRSALPGDGRAMEAALSLLAAHDRADGFLEDPTVDTVAPPAPIQAEGPGSRIGPYKLLQLIGEGGFGQVFMAEQEAPVRRRVALKIIKLGMDTRQVVARFEQERQALALMDHPNIARVFDAAATPAGRPYFVMELVNGVPISQFADESHLTIAQRVELLIPVCHAVQHAHQRGIIHRDLKPGNVLVTLHDGVPVPKVIDFGIAKAAGEPLTERTLFTAINQLVGTPAYMSPEQAERSGLDVDTRADVYSLGALMYELVTGSPPFSGRELAAAGLSEMQRILREVDPPRPSHRISTLRDALPSVAASRRVEPARLGLLLRGDLDWIVMKAMEKDRRRRYATVGELAADLARYLAHEGVSAAPPSAAYAARKFVRRHRVAVGVAAAVALALGIGVASISLSLAHAVEQRRITQRALERAEAEGTSAARTAAFLSRVLDGAAPAVARGRDAAMLAEMMDDAVRRIDAGSLDDAPAAAVQLTRTIGLTYAALGRPEDGARLLERSVGLAQGVFGPSHRETALSENALAGVRTRYQGRAAEGERLARSALDTLRAASPRDEDGVLRVMAQVGAATAALGRAVEAEAVYRDVLETHERLGLGVTEAYAGRLNNLAGMVSAAGRPKEAEELYRRAVAAYESAVGEDHPDTATALSNLSLALGRSGKYEESLAAARRSVEVRRRILPPDHPDLVQGLGNVGVALQSLGRHAEAEPILREVLEARRRAHPDGHPDLASALSNLGLLLLAVNKPADAEPMLREAVEIRRRTQGGDRPEVATLLSNLAGVLQAQGKVPEAAALIEEALAIYRERYPGDHPMTAALLSNLGGMRQSTGDHAAAEPLFRDSLEMRRRLLGARHPDVGTGASNLGSTLRLLGRPAEAEPLLREALSIRREAFQGDHQFVALTMAQLGRCLSDLGQLDEAVTLTEDAAAMAARVLPAGHPIRKRCDEARDLVADKRKAASPP